LTETAPLAKKPAGSLTIGGQPFKTIHFAGILGAGMSALAQFLSWSGLGITGSDRLASAGEMKNCREKLEGAGCRIFPQDGSGLAEVPEALAVSTAIEERNPDLAAARKRGIPVLHRSDLLSAIVSTRRTLAVCGTSGKSTVAAMVFEILRGCGRSPSLLTGAPLLSLNEEGLFGNAFKGNSDLLVIEADESDGTLVKYRPELAVFLNLSKDHQPVAVTLELFQRLSRQTGRVIKNADDPGLALLPADQTFGLSPGAGWRPERVHATAPGIRFSRGGIEYELAMAGAHNLQNALAALCVCAARGCAPAEMTTPLSRFKGISRRFSVARTPAGTAVIDDYAHNPQKIRAALLAAREFGNRVFAVFQPHGFAPTRFLRDELVEAFSSLMRAGDEVFFLPIYYAGGTVQKDISAEDLAERVSRRGISSRAVQDRPGLLAALKKRAKPGDAVLLMGARDPSLSFLALEIREALE
jgi:UDP-N-acetylmuramate--alanine ligase